MNWHHILIAVAVTLIPLNSQASEVTSNEQEYQKEFLRKATEIGKELDNKESTLLQKLVKSEALFDVYDEDPVATDIIAQYSSTYFSFAGEHRRALAIADIGQSIKKDDKPALDLSVFNATPAVEAILDVARTQTVVMVNEAHHIAQHRALTYDLLEGLWDSGFRYFALEALSSSEALPFDGPLKRNSGYYTQEPLFAYMISHALELGYKLIPYDSGGDTQTREKEAAANLKRDIFDKDPSAKILIHVGYSHIDESGWLAKNLKDAIGVDPLTIDQVKFSEKSKPVFEHQNYEKVLAHFQNKEPIVLFDNQNEFYSSEPNKWDVSVFSPRTNYFSNKPNWMLKEREAIKLEPSLCEGSYPCLVEAFSHEYAQEEDLLEFIPYDKTVINSELDKKVILVGSEKTLIVVTDENRTILSQRVVEQ